MPVSVKNLLTGFHGKVPASKFGYFPKISGTRVVWVEWVNGDKWIVYVNNLKTGSTNRLLPSKKDQFYPSIDCTRVVWDQIYNGMYTVFIKNLTTGVIAKISSLSLSTGYFPDISDNIVVWEHPDPSINRERIYIKNLSTGISGRLTP